MNGHEDLFISLMSTLIIIYLSDYSLNTPWDSPDRLLIPPLINVINEIHWKKTNMSDK